jgi:hypothetical protein
MKISINFNKRTAMRKILLGFLAFFLAGQVSFAQPVSDNAVIPMGITLNSILRLNVVSGGNIEFVFNSLNDYTNGLAGDQYRTNLTVASSTNWSLGIYASNVFTGDLGTIALNFVAYRFENNGAVNVLGDNGGGTATEVSAAIATLAGYGDLTNAFTADLISGSGNAGASTDNDFYVRWECGTANTTGGAIGNAAADPGRYSTNVLISLLATP